MKIPGAHFQIVTNKSTHFQKNPCNHFLEHTWTKSCLYMGEGRRDSQTDGQSKTNIHPPNFVCRGMIRSCFLMNSAKDPVL